MGFVIVHMEEALGNFSRLDLSYSTFSLFVANFEMERSNNNLWERKLRLVYTALPSTKTTLHFPSIHMTLIGPKGKKSGKKCSVNEARFPMVSADGGLRGIIFCPHSPPAP